MGRITAGAVMKQVNGEFLYLIYPTWERRHDIRRDNAYLQNAARIPFAHIIRGH